MTVSIDSLDPVYGDAVLPFEIEGMDIRGRVTRLGNAANTILCRHNYPEPVARLLGEALALSALMGTMLKYEGIFTFQTKGDGPISFIVADYASTRSADGRLSGGGNLRGYAQFDKAAVEALMAGGSGARLGLTELLGKGYLALTIDQGEHMERYQGIVELEGDSLTDCALNYFRTSEQLPTQIKVVSSHVPEAGGGSSWRASAIMIQHLPRGGQENRIATAEHEAETTENWQRASALMASATLGEMCDMGLPLHELLYRLYHEDGVRVHEAAHLLTGCRCGTKRFDQIMASFPREDLVDMADDGKITLTCEFCTRSYVFELSDLLPKLA